MGRRLPRYVMLIYSDEDTMTFNVEGPVYYDDRAVTKRTVELQRTGRNVHISTTNPEVDRRKVPDRAALIRQGLSGYTYDPNLKW